MATPEKKPQEWRMKDLESLGKRGRKTYLRAVPVLILEKWVRGGKQEGKANYIENWEVDDRLISCKLRGPYKKKGRGSALGSLNMMQGEKTGQNLTNPPLIRFERAGTWWINLPRYEGLLEAYRKRYREDFPDDYKKLFPAGEPWEQPSPSEESVEQEERKLTSSVSEEQDQIESVLEPVRQLLVRLTEENRRLRELERENEKLREELGQDLTELNDLFVSYSHRNSQQGKGIADRAEEKNLRVFQDEKIEYGSDFGDEIRHELLRSRELCVLVTREALKSEWVTTEWGAAWALGKTITPILLRCDVEQLPARLRSLRCVDYHNVGKYLDQVAKRKSSL